MQLATRLFRPPRHPSMSTVLRWYLFYILLLLLLLLLLATSTSTTFRCPWSINSGFNRSQATWAISAIRQYKIEPRILRNFWNDETLLARATRTLMDRFRYTGSGSLQKSFTISYKYRRAKLIQESRDQPPGKLKGALLNPMSEFAL